MKPTSITENVKLIVKNTFNDMINRVEENVNIDVPSPAIKNRKKTMWCQSNRKNTPLDLKQKLSLNIRL